MLFPHPQSAWGIASPKLENGHRVSLFIESPESTLKHKVNNRGPIFETIAFLQRTTLTWREANFYVTILNNIHFSVDFLHGFRVFKFSCFL